ncbi:MAG: hypothetical protein UHD64_05840, partial [Bacteroidales bacterium]|nr:hypothetical protein [Bacteroidales bacterium]
MQAVIQNMKTEMENLNKLVFKGLDDEISGIIDTFDEFSAALEDVASSMDLLHTAQTQMNTSGQISVKTALELIASTDQWNQVLAIENGQIKLVDGAEQALIQTKLNAIKSNIELALQEVNTSLAMLDAGDAAITLSDKLGNWLTTAIDKVKEGLAWLDGAAGALWDNLWNGGGNDVVAAGNAAAAKVTKSRANEISDLQRQKANLEAQKAMLERIDTVDEFKNYYDYDTTPGDKYKDDGTSDLLDKLQKKYERKISNLDNQQTYLENEIERLEAENKGVSKSYYEEQIKLEEQKMTLLQQERTELTALLNSTKKGTDDWWEIADALWEVEHSIQESTLRTIEFRESIADLYKTAFEDLDKAYGDKDDLYADRQAYIEKYMELLELQGKAKPASAYMGLIAEEEAKLANSMAELYDLRQVLADGMTSGEIKAGDERWVEMQSSIRETEAAILDSKVAIEQYKEELKSLQVEAFELVRTAFSNRNDYYTHQQDYIEGYIDYLEATGVDATPEMYEKLIEIEQEKRANNVADLVDARAGLAKLEAAGYTAADEEWVDANNSIVELEKNIQDSDIAMAEWQKTIREMDFEKFDRFAERVNSLNEELSNVYKLVEDEDVAFDDGTWTKEGITALSMLYHQIENNEKMIAEYNEELAKLEKQYKSGEISEKEYTERAEELKDNQWDLVHTNEDLKDSIIDINEARIDLVEEGINEEIDAYKELIELKKEELDAERDLYEFKRDVEKQTKDIAELQRRLSAISGSDDPADIAERRKLEAQLREAQDGLNDTYYGHSKDSQSKALDDELDAYQKSAEDYMESLREQLENTEAMIEQTFTDVLLNADVTYQGLIEISNIYGPTLSANLMNPWQQMSNQAVIAKQQIGDQLLLLNEDNIAQFTEQTTPLLKQPFESGGFAAEAFKITVTTQIDEIQTRINTTTSEVTREFDAMMAHANISTNTFSKTVEAKLTGAVATAQLKAVEMENYLTYPWENGTEAANTWSKKVESALNKTVQDYKDAAAEISKQRAVIDNTPSYTTDKTTTTTTTKTDNGSALKPTQTTPKMKKTGTLGQETSDYFGQSPYNTYNSGMVTIDG